MAHPKIFCNTPWYELHIYWDGSLGICCQEDHKLYNQSQDYNIATTSIKDWFNSPPARELRRSMMGDSRVSACRRCYVEEDAGGISRRIRSNAKSVIFTQAFEPSFRQSPGHAHFSKSADSQGAADTLPIDIHVDLGNFCNLACKMCNSQASSTIAAQEVKWGIVSSRQYLGTDWTRNEHVWQSFLNQLMDIPRLRNIHFMGGETLLTSRLEDLVDFFTLRERFDVCFSFVTNGTVYKPKLLEKLSRFSRVGIEISVETMTVHNQYQRQGTDNNLIQENIKKYQAWSDGSRITVALRPAVSLLTIGNYHTLLEYAINHQLVVKSLLVTKPGFLDAKILPTDVKKLYLERICDWAQTIQWPDSSCGDFNASDPNNCLHIVGAQLDVVKHLLASEFPEDGTERLEKMVRHCEKWDKIYGLDARLMYPELGAVWDQYCYAV